MNARDAAGIVLLCGVLLSCTVSEKGPREVLKAEGESVRIELTGHRKFAAELLYLNDTSLYFLSEVVHRIALTEVVSVKVEGYGLFNDHAVLRDRLEPYCRYPKGLSDAQWRQLLDHYGQKELVELPGR